MPISCSAQKNSNQKSPNEFDQKLADSLGADKYGMKQYILVILKTGKANITDKDLLNNHFRAHMENIKRLAKEGKLALAGPPSPRKTREIIAEFLSLM